MDFISAHLLLIFYSWSKHKRICTVRQYSGSLAHPRGMYYNGKEGKEQCINRIQFTLGFLRIVKLANIVIFDHGVSVTSVAN